LKFGIYYSYWEQEWSADCLKYVEKVAKLGFDVIEIAAHHLNSYSAAHIAEVGRSARDNGITITAGLGPSQQRNLSSADPAIRKAGRAFFEETLTNLAKLDIRVIGGALHSYWPIDYSKPVDKPGDRARGLEGISSLTDFAGNLGVNLCLEVLNRFENHVLNTAEEGVAFVREIGKPNVKVMLDTFHMNIEEDSFGKAIRTAGPLLGHFHTGENNRRVPGKGGLPWHEIGTALREIGYPRPVVMEPFVKMGGQVGADIRVWRDLSDNADEAQMDELRDKLWHSRDTCLVESQRDNWRRIPSAMRMAARFRTPGRGVRCGGALRRTSTSGIGTACGRCPTMSSCIGARFASAVRTLDCTSRCKPRSTARGSPRPGLRRAAPTEEMR
jgi:D-psicose/D-tagatose/L-ribulose 3-epimerase